VIIKENFNQGKMKRAKFGMSALKAISIILPIAVILSFLNDMGNSAWIDGSNLSLNGLGMLVTIGFIAWVAISIALFFIRDIRRRLGETGERRQRTDRGKGHSRAESGVVDATGWKVK